ncbi:hypothetical protein RRG08_030710 [Elysia crispata]|uniref:Uncharacterized protein n=1 Tax=Elysia crispata TaxID=231223 RepID=A0AAE0Y4I7_9GAST|nr:hypothetical protein RRG08_030710 [Elysia crispata]
MQGRQTWKAREQVTWVSAETAPYSSRAQPSVHWFTVHSSHRFVYHSPIGPRAAVSTAAAVLGIQREFI